jgi:hypothetical protein
MLSQFSNYKKLLTITISFILFVHKFHFVNLFRAALYRLILETMLNALVHFLHRSKKMSMQFCHIFQGNQHKEELATNQMNHTLVVYFCLMSMIRTKFANPRSCDTLQFWKYEFGLCISQPLLAPPRIKATKLFYNSKMWSTVYL